MIFKLCLTLLNLLNGLMTILILVLGRLIFPTCVSDIVQLRNVCQFIFSLPSKMPKPVKKRSKKESDTDDSDSGPDDRSVVKKSKAASSEAETTSVSSAGHALPGPEPSWLLGGTKFVKV